MADARIMYVRRSAERHEGITHLGGDTWKWTKEQVIDSIESKTNTFYTLVGTKRADIAVRQGQNGKHLQTHADQAWNNNLLALPDFPGGR